MTGKLLWRQFSVLFWKNWIVLSKHSWLNLVRCFILPIGYGIFLAVAQIFLSRPNNYGIGEPTPIRDLRRAYSGSTPLWWADGTNGTASPSPQDIMSHITQGLTPKQLRNVKKAMNIDDIPGHCPQNFNGFSECFAAIAFNPVDNTITDTSGGRPAATSALSSARPTSTPTTSHHGTFNDTIIAVPGTRVAYTIMADAGLFRIDVKKHTSDFEKRILPLQLAVDQAIISLSTGVNIPKPLEWPFTQETNKEQFTKLRLSYIRGIRTLLVLALFICYIGIAYQLPGAFMGERANLLTSHLKAMGLYDSARILSWHLSHCLAYLPAWIIVALVWHFRIFTGTHVLLVLAVHLLFGLSLASYSLFLATPFGSSPQLAAVTSTFLSIVLAIIALIIRRPGNGVAFIFSVIFPPGFYIFAIKAICGWENEQIPTNASKGDPDDGLRLLPLMIAALIDIFLWPWLAVLLERHLYDPKSPSARRSWFSRLFGKREGMIPQDVNVSPDIAISVRNLHKKYLPGWFGRKQAVTAVEDLSFDVPKNGIFVLLGSNGAGKSTTLSILGNLLGRTSGSVTFSGGVTRPPRGTLGIVPQKNVFFPELSCLQNIRVWQAVKHNALNGDDKEDIEQLLRDCDLGLKIHANASTLSGGQKRKLQLAAGLVGGSNVVLVDECTSGVDPLSRRALWRILTSVRHNRTIIFTTHFLDEADLLGDHIAILAAPGKLVAHGTPVSLKTTLGEGYILQVTFNAASLDDKVVPIPPLALVQDRLRTVAPDTYYTVQSPSQAAFHLKTKDPRTVEASLRILSADAHEFSVVSYDVHGTSIEDIFLGLIATNDKTLTLPEKKVDTEKSQTSSIQSLPPDNATTVALQLTTGRPRSPYSQAFTIFHKRVMIARRSWLTPALAILVAICGACIPIFFISNRSKTCATTFHSSEVLPLYFPISPLTFVNTRRGSDILVTPPGIASDLGVTAATLNISNIQDNSTFVSDIQQNFRNLSLGGVSINTNSLESLVAWEATAPGYTGPTMLNLASNVLYNRALNQSGFALTSSIINANFQYFPPVDAGTLVALKWVAFFGAAMSVYPAFFSLYVSRERRSSVQAMQLSNGLSDPIGLWLGHLLFDSIFSVFAASIIIVVFGTASEQFSGLGFFWVVLVLYGIAGTLFAYCTSLFVATPLASFAVMAGYQIIMFILYLAAYLLILTYAKTSNADREMTIVHYTLSMASPVASAMRAAFVSVNLFSLLCSGSAPVTTASMGTIGRYGGPILYLFCWSFFLFGVLVWMDSGSVLSRKATRDISTAAPANTIPRPDVEAEAKAVVHSDDALRVLNVSKSFGPNKVLHDVTLGVSRGTIFGLLGPNGAGKTSLFRQICGDLTPDRGNILIENTSVVRHPRIARLNLGVCPQFTAIDPQLTVREHLAVYGRLKGLMRGAELHHNVEIVMRATTLDNYADRLASTLSGGNQRKLSLAISLMGNPSVVLIDEFSSGIDPRTRRDMWNTLRAVATGKAVVITTHSMEEAAALANKVGILAKRLLAVGTTDILAARYANYEVHFTCRTGEDVRRAQELMRRIPGSRMADDVATRFEVPIDPTDRRGLSLASLFGILAEHGDFAEYTVERPSLESVFLKVIREANVAEEDSTPSRRRRWWPIHR
ncbi:hypothetical protein PUNSTDRAFT_96008 [Punctularia strigosozonata HHB-11173 SS5]|uniref:uncharacterized protein n=1 Tax=Punctularia strigosozonata (strain HHB-11173) TaxID=741275 RepID=UPI0004416E72|nr:uncharacterized protein PUNSTDRAFT_96008 [Punctularia strigosozonata HHB-11173 SS5]EIN14277.1 hypothetical protein PUNSTDRAFT_96008 [Punctularia strigosozonata HHB-11173 SS5]